jgi:hypothetical protein
MIIQWGTGTTYQDTGYFIGKQVVFDNLSIILASVAALDLFNAQIKSLKDQNQLKLLKDQNQLKYIQ